MAFFDLLELVHLYVGHAQNAAQQGRQQAAHGLFQTALTFYERAACLIKSSDEPFVHGRLLEARHRIDECAANIYGAERAPFVFSEELLRNR